MTGAAVAFAAVVEVEIDAAKSLGLDAGSLAAFLRAGAAEAIVRDAAEAEAEAAAATGRAAVAATERVKEEEARAIVFFVW